MARPALRGLDGCQMVAHQTALLAEQCPFGPTSFELGPLGASTGLDWPRPPQSTGNHCIELHLRPAPYFFSRTRPTLVVGALAAVCPSRADYFGSFTGLFGYSLYFSCEGPCSSVAPRILWGWLHAAKRAACAGDSSRRRSYIGDWCGAYERAQSRWATANRWSVSVHCPNCRPRHVEYFSRRLGC